MKTVTERWAHHDLVGFVTGMAEAGWDVDMQQAEGTLEISRVDDRTGKRLVIFEAIQTPVQVDSTGTLNVETEWAVSFSAILLGALHTAITGRGES